MGNYKGVFVSMVGLLLVEIGFGQNVGIGTTTPASKLDISGGLTVGSNYAGINAAPVNGALIEGIVGIGTASPTVSLDVNGQIRMRTGAANGYIPVGDANGVMNWTDPATIFTGNTLDGAYDQGGPGTGRIIIADAGVVSIQGTDGLEVTGTFGGGDTIMTTTGVRMFFNPRKAAFRAGTTSNAAWDNANVGDYSFASGFNTYATGSHSVSMGAYNIASGNYSAAFGYHTYTTNAHAFGAGSNNNATGAGSVVLGSNSTASASGSVSLGAYNDVAGNYSIATGYNNIVGGAYSVAMGGSNSVHNQHNVALGHSNTVFGTDAHAYGYGLTNYSFNEILVGRYNTVIPAYSQSTWDGRDRIFTVGNGASSASRSTAMVVLQSGEVGIGTVSPVELLDVRGSALFNEDGGDNDFRIEGDNKTHLFFADASTDRIGIGNSAPLFDLHVGDGTLSAINTADTRIVSSNDANQNRAAFLALARDVGGNRIEAQFEADGQFNDAVIVGATTSHPIHFRTGNINRMGLSTTGNLGIGTTTPDVRLHVATGTDVAITGGGYIQLGASTGANIGIDNNEIMARNNGATSTLYIQNNGGFTYFGDYVGLGTTIPNQRLEISQTGYSAARITSTNASVAAVEFLRTGNGFSDWRMMNSGGIFYIGQSSDDLTTVSDVVRIGGSSLTPASDNFVTLGNSGLRWTAVYAVNGTIQTSDARDKTNMLPLHYGLTEVLKLKPVTYQWKDDPDAVPKIGLVAQDVQQIIPEAVMDWDWEVNEETGERRKVEAERLGVYYSDLIPVLTKAIQEQHALIESLQREVNELKQILGAE